MELIQITVKNCQECPFVQWDDVEGYNGCAVGESVISKPYEQLPSDKVHDNCPLLKNAIIVVKESTLPI